MDHAIICGFHCPCSLCKILGEQPAESAVVRLIPRVSNEEIPRVYEARELPSADQGLGIPGDGFRGLPF